MVQCKICGKVVRTTQGLRGHNTFKHGLRANRSKPTVALAHNQLVDETSGLVEHCRPSAIMGHK